MVVFKIWPWLDLQHYAATRLEVGDKLVAGISGVNKEGELVIMLARFPLRPMFTSLIHELFHIIMHLLGVNFGHEIHNDWDRGWKRIMWPIYDVIYK